MTDPGDVYRIGYVPDPFAWTPWQYATDGRFGGRWDDPDGLYRTLYVGGSLLSCLLEVLAPFRPDLALVAELAGIADTDGQDELFPTVPAGRVPRSWVMPRRVGAAVLGGDFVDVRAPITLATLRTRFAAVAADLGLVDLDASAVKLAAPRTLTQAISSWCYRDVAPPVTGVCFASRFGDDLAMWAIFEQPGEDTTGSTALTDHHVAELTADDADLLEAFRIHGLSWATASRGFVG